MNGPLSDDLLESMTKYFSRLCGVSMVLDPDSYGHEVFDENRGRYQWKVAGGRSADHQGIAFKVGGVTEVYVITRNQVDVVIRVRTERRHEIARMHPEEVVSPTFGAVFTEAMRPYVAVGPVVSVGDSAALKFSVEWATAELHGDAEARTRGAAVLEVNGRQVWGTSDAPFEWTWIEILESLAECWRFLVWEQTYPDGLNPRTPLLLETAFETRREHMQPAQAAELHDAVLSFVEHHDLAAGLCGATAPPVRLLREGAACTVATPFSVASLPFELVTGILEGVAEAILARLVGATDARSVRAREDWETRASVSEN